jgi:putative oxidoreductase
MSQLLRTKGGAAGLVLRLTLAIVIFPHAAQKVFGWFGGYGISGTMGYFTGQMGLPWLIAALVIAFEFLGSLGLLFGFLTRLCALGIGTVMVGAIFTVHAGNGFFMNWSGQQAGEGFEYHLLVIGIAAALVIAGGGRWSVDGAVADRV